MVGEKKSIRHHPHLPPSCVQRRGLVGGLGGVEQEDGSLVQGQVPVGRVLVWLVGVHLVCLSACPSPSPSKCYTIYMIADIICYLVNPHVL